MLPRILFYTAGGRHSEYSTGHLSRCLLTIKKISALNPGARFSFMIPYDSNGVAILRKAGYLPLTYKTAGERSKKLTEHFLKWKPDIVVLDRLDCPPPFVKWLTGFKKVVISVDDSGKSAEIADFSINPLIPNPASDFSGYAYLLSSPHRFRVAMPAHARHCLISFGGYEPGNVTLKLLKVLSKYPGVSGVHFHVFGGIDTTSAAEAKRLLKSFGRYSRFYDYSPRFFDVLDKVDTAIVGGGLTMFETTRRGIATGVIELRKHQNYNIRILAENRVALAFGRWNKINKPAFQTSLDELFAKARCRASLWSRSKAYWSRLRTERTYENLLQVITPAVGKKMNAKLWPLRITPAIADYAEKYCQHHDFKMG